MKLFKYILSAVILFGALPVTQAMNLSSENVSEVKKKEKKKKKKGLNGNIQKKKKPFHVKVFGTDRP